MLQIINKMKIAVDASQMNSVYTGVGRYLYNLLKHMAPLSRDTEYTLFFSSDIKLKLDYKNIKKVILKTNRGNLYWQNFVLNKALKRGSYDILWSPNYYSPIFYKGKSVISMHDVSWKALKNNYGLFNKIVRDKLSKKSLRKASCVFTLSEFSKKEITKYYKTDPSLIKVIHLAIDDSFKRSDFQLIKEFKQKHGISDEPVIGFLGSIFKRRNVDKLINSFHYLKKSFPKLKLILVGENYDDSVKLPDIDTSIIWIKRLSEKDIKHFYSSLDLFVYISEYEGFGFPPLESLSCGTVPLLLAKTALKEIYTDMGLFIEEPNVERIVEKVSYFLGNKKGISKKILNEFNKKEEYFAWERAAEEYIKEFRKFDQS